jgi:hypothetical protein
MQIVRRNTFVQFLSCSVVLAPNENGMFASFRRYLLHPSSVSKYVGLIGPVIGADDSKSSFRESDGLKCLKNKIIYSRHSNFGARSSVIHRNVGNVDTHKN